jgi:hypothetical protein
MEKIFAVLAVVAVFLFFSIGLSALGALPIWALWNFVVADMVHARHLLFVQVWALIVFLRLVIPSRSAPSAA